MVDECFGKSTHSAVSALRNESLMPTVDFSGGNSHFREAVLSRVRTVSDLKGVSLHFVWCEDEEPWTPAGNSTSDGQRVTICVVPVDSAMWFARALAFGADGVVVQDADSSEVLEVVTRAIRGEVVLPHHVAVELAGSGGRWVAPLDLTRAERQVLWYLGSGSSIADVAAASYLSERTVRRRIQALQRKFEAPNRSAMLVKAVAMGLVDPWEPTP